MSICAYGKMTPYTDRARPRVDPLGWDAQLEPAGASARTRVFRQGVTDCYSLLKTRPIHRRACDVIDATATEAFRMTASKKQNRFHTYLLIF